MSVPRKVKAIVTDLKKYRDNVTLYSFKPEYKVRFRPGQFLHLALDNYDPSYNWPESRVFSIANAPSKEFIDILVSPKGNFTRRMIDEISVGKQVWLKLPYGTFNFRESYGKDVVLIAGGTGITPFISFLDDSLENRGSYRSINLFYGIREPDLIIFGKNIEAFKLKINEFNYSIYCENLNDNSDTRVKSGILPVKEIVDKTVLFEDPVYFLSGPKLMIETFEKELKFKGMQSERIFFDEWE